MKAVMPDVPDHILAWRRRTGEDRWDEMWEGVLHMSPSPAVEHQELVFRLLSWLQMHWAEPSEGRAYMQVNIAEPETWPGNYRIPDISLITPERLDIVRELYLEGGPDVVVEIRSPGDESYEKLPFYAKVGVREAWIIDRETKRPEVYELVGDEMTPRQPGGEGWLRSPATNAELQTLDGKLAIRVVGRAETLARLP